MATDFSTWPHRKTNFESQPLTSNPSRNISPEKTYNINWNAYDHWKTGISVSSDSI